MRHDAGNTGRHETPSETGLWDRLRADLNNLGAAYGPITEGVGEAVVTPEPVEILAADASFWRDVAKITGVTDFVRGATSSGTGKFDIAFESTYPNCNDSDRNAYFDGIILAARKKREREYGSLIYDPTSDNGHEWSWNTDACAHCGLTSTAIVEFGDVKCDGGKARDGSLSLSAAMSRPLDWEPRVGHKGVEING